MHLLANKNILIAVTGSIAIYKILELIRLYIKSGANVKVIMTQSAKKFVSPLSFETISQNKILDNENENWAKESINNHIAIGKWADIFIIAPASANTINKLSNGIADNILLQAALAYPQIKLLVPAANTNMINNPLTQASLTILKLYNFKLIQTQTKELACRDIGDGAMADIQDIFHVTLKELLKDDYWENRKVVLTGGGTIEKIDDVRYISNFSSGKMAANLATALYYQGANVCLITTKNLDTPKEINTIFVQSSNEMFEYTQNSLKIAIEGTQKKPYFFSVAAVSDYVPSCLQSGKLKKDTMADTWNLKLKKNIDILKSVTTNRIYTIGFKAELDKHTAKINATNMLANKNLDAVCLNIINDQNNFGSNENEIEIITKTNNINLPQDTKLNISFNLLNNLKEQFSE
jgi:phosphopantothenoylcysteine decarboxylase / phosphopantothenate---cysteine ligase